jgi:hypothetical protein
MADRERAAERVFAEALSQRPERRSAFLDQVCRGAPELRQMVEDLLRENDRQSIAPLNWRHHFALPRN